MARADNRKEARTAREVQNENSSEVIPRIYEREEASRTTIICLECSHKWTVKTEHEPDECPQCGSSVLDTDDD
jgi:uncharacterized CHY-type Zn-finger protein